ncbi:hypothetical protein [Streptomyces sp. NPDC051452]|uniref:hypothetical protein n=1 Tax=Streptomyces sp. NPDC051452 TaxID=3365654 RepID=UPI0037B38CED
MQDFLTPAGELTSSLINRAADRYSLPTASVQRLWTGRNSPTRHDDGDAALPAVEEDVVP